MNTSNSNRDAALNAALSSVRERAERLNEMLSTLAANPHRNQNQINELFSRIDEAHALAQQITEALARLHGV